MPTVVKRPDFPIASDRWTFSLGLTTGATTWLSGHTASEHDGERVVVRGGLAQQAARAWEKVGMLIEAAGLGPEHVVRVCEYVRADALEEAEAVDDARRAFLGAAADPAVNRVVVPGLMRPDAAIEVEVTCHVPDADDAVDREVAVTSAAGIVPVGAAPARVAGDLVWVSSVLATDAEGRIVGGDDLVAQTAQVYENLAAALGALDMTTHDIVKTVEFVRPHTRRDYPRTGRIRRERLSAPYGGATGIVMDVLPHPDALIQVDVLASRAPREAVTCGWSRYEKLTYNPGLRVGDLLVMSGQAALDVETEQAVHPGDVVAQARYTYENVVRVLEAAGLGPEHLVRTVEYLVPEAVPRARETAEVRRELLGDPFPAATGVECSGLLRPEFLLEVDPFAVFPAYEAPDRDEAAASDAGGAP